MKITIAFFGGFLAGMLALLVFQNFQMMTLSRNATPANFDFRFATERISQPVDYSAPVYIADQSGMEFKLIFEPASDGRVNYRWEASSDSTRNGSGTLFEKYETVGKTADGIKVKDVGSQLRIKLENFQLEWSGGESSNGWIYYHPADLRIINKPKD